MLSGVKSPRCSWSEPQDSQSLRIAPREEFAGPGGMQMLQAASMELTTETRSAFHEGENNVEA